MNISMTEAARQFDAEHRELEATINEIRDWWQQIHELGQPHFGEMGDRLYTFREKLSEHFQHEEDAGVLSYVVSTPSQDVTRLAELRDEHTAMLASLDNLINRLRAADPDFEFWGESGAEFERFLKQLACHEQAEASLMGGIS